jgi:repressor LexA
MYITWAAKVGPTKTTEAEAPMTRSMAADGAELANWADPDPDHVLTWRQQKILQVITDFAQRRRYAPTLREIGTAAGLSSTSSVSYQLAVLQGKGYLRRDERRPRMVEVRLPGREAVRAGGCPP